MGSFILWIFTCTSREKLAQTSSYANYIHTKSMYIDKNMEEIKEKGVIFDINFTPPINWREDDIKCLGYMQIIIIQN